MKPENRFSAVLGEICERRLLSEEQLALPEDFEFSESFEHRMQKLFAPDKKPRIRSRLKASLIIAAIFAAGFLLGMAREPIWNYIFEPADGGRMVSFDPSTVNEPKKKLEEVYTLNGLPDSFVPETEEIRSQSAVHIWTERNSGTTYSKYIYLGQYTVWTYRDAYFSEDTKTNYYFDEEGSQYFIGEVAGEELYTAIVWYKNGYVMLLAGSFTKEQGLELCKALTVEQAEN